MESSDHCACVDGPDGISDTFVHWDLMWPFGITLMQPFLFGYLLIWIFNCNSRVLDSECYLKSLLDYSATVFQSIYLVAVEWTQLYESFSWRAIWYLDSDTQSALVSDFSRYLRYFHNIIHGSLKTTKYLQSKLINNSLIDRSGDAWPSFAVLAISPGRLYHPSHDTATIECLIHLHRVIYILFTTNDVRCYRNA